MGNEVVVARDGVEALDFFFGRSDYAARDTAIMSRMDGLGMLRRIRADERTALLSVAAFSSSDLAPA